MILGHTPLASATLVGGRLGVSRSALPSYNASVITAVANVQQGVAVPKFLFGGRGGVGEEEYGLFQKSSSYAFTMWRSERFLINKRFSLEEIEISFTTALTTDTLIIPVLSFDDDSRRVEGKDINLMNYTDAPTSIVLKSDDFRNDTGGEKNFALEFHFRGIDLNGILLPINMTIDVEER